VTDTSILYSLQPVNFIYRGDLDRVKQTGYIAEDTFNINKDFATYDDVNGPGCSINWNAITVYTVEELRKLKKFTGKGTIPTGSLSNVVSVSGVSWNSPVIQVTPIFSINTGVRNLNVSLFDSSSNSFTVYGGPGDFFWSVTS
jgi:hypothetical protein